MWAIVPFFSALALFAVFFGFRAWEMKRGRRIYEAFRSKMDEKARTLYASLVTGHISSAWRVHTFALLYKAFHRAVVFSVEILRTIERPLTRLSHHLRTRPPSTNAQEVSPFLKNIAPDKKNSEENGTTPPAGV